MLPTSCTGICSWASTRIKLTIRNSKEDLRRSWKEFCPRQAWWQGARKGKWGAEVPPKRGDTSIRHHKSITKQNSSLPAKRWTKRARPPGRQPRFYWKRIISKSKKGSSEFYTLTEKGEELADLMGADEEDSLILINDLKLIGIEAPFLQKTIVRAFRSKASGWKPWESEKRWSRKWMFWGKHHWVIQEWSQDIFAASWLTTLFHDLFLAILTIHLLWCFLPWIVFSRV